MSLGNSGKITDINSILSVIMLNLNLLMPPIESQKLTLF